MSESCTATVLGAIESGGHSSPRRDKNVPRKFGAVAKLLWPRDTAAHIAAIGRVDVRTGKRWLAGEAEPSAAVILACVQEMLRK